MSPMSFFIVIVRIEIIMDLFEFVRFVANFIGSATALSLLDIVALLASHPPPPVLTRVCSCLV